MRVQSCWLLAALVLTAGCGKEERAEAVRFSKVLAGKQAEFTDANKLEKDLVDSARAWCDDITANGAGRGPQLDQNARLAAEMAKSAVAISSKIGQVRQAVYDQSLRQEYPQSIRTGLITQLTNRQRLLQQMRGLLEQSEPEFLQFRNDKSYMGDSYPGSMGRLAALLQAYRTPDDVVASALTSLRAKYSLTASEL